MVGCSCSHPRPGFIPSRHEVITRAALGELAGSRLEAVVAANLDQDRGDAFADPVNHADDNLVPQALSRLRAWVALARARLLAGGSPEAAAADLGKACHAVQDLISHSNYLELATSDGRYGSPQEVPAPEFADREPDSALVTGTYDPDDPDRPGTPEHPTHADLNKDYPESPQGMQPVAGMPGRTLYEVAHHVAVRETQALHRSFLQKLNGLSRRRWQEADARP